MIGWVLLAAVVLVIVILIGMYNSPSCTRSVTRALTFTRPWRDVSCTRLPLSMPRAC